MPLPTKRPHAAAAVKLRSLLFAPASRPDVLAKLPRSGPDAVVLDLEDAVAAPAKAQARVHAREMGRRLRTDHPDLVVLVRVNAVATEWFTDDMAEALDPAITGVVVPKLESPEQVAEVSRALDDQGLDHLVVVAGIETVAGVDRAESVLGTRVGAAYFGAEDYVADLGGIRTPGSTEVLYARSRVAIKARLVGIPALDQVVTDYGDEQGFRADADVGRSLGFVGKLCIHPSQVALANERFSPTEAEIEHAHRLLAVYDEALAAGHGVVAFEGQMIDEPLARRARAILSAASD